MADVFQAPSLFDTLEIHGQVLRVSLQHRVNLSVGQWLLHYLVGWGQWPGVLLAGLIGFSGFSSIQCLEFSSYLEIILEGPGLRLGLDKLTKVDFPKVNLVDQVQGTFG